MLSLSTLIRLARAHILGYVSVLTHPESEAADQGPRLGASETASRQAVMALAKHLRARAAAGGDAEAARLTLSATIQESATYQGRPAIRCAGR